MHVLKHRHPGGLKKQILLEIDSAITWKFEPLPEAKTARYVRLYIDGYTANAADDQTNWRSVSLYDFQIYANEIPDTVLPDENYCLEGTAEASNFEEVQSEPGKQGPAKAIDGDLTTRWATESDGKGTTARTLTVKLPAAQW